jgi:CBS domain-containing protein
MEFLIIKILMTIMTDYQTIKKLQREQTLRTDQDNGIIFLSGDEGEKEDDYLAVLGERVVKALEACGFPLCPGNMMVTNPEWRRSMGDWERILEEWFVHPTREIMLKTSVFFDLRGVYGDKGLVERLWDIIFGYVKVYPGFVARMGKSSAEIKPPIGLFGRFIVEKSGEHKDTIDIKLRGCLPIVEGVRALALIEGIKETNTFNRIEALAQTGSLPPDMADELLFTYQVLLTLRIRNHIRLFKEGKQIHNHVNPSSLAKRERQILKDCFASIYRLQELVMTKTEAVFLPD